MAVGALAIGTTSCSGSGMRTFVVAGGLRVVFFISVLAKSYMVYLRF